MKQSDENIKNSGSNAPLGNSGQRKTKLQPVAKEKYKPKQIYRFQEDDANEELDLFGYLEEEE